MEEGELKPAHLPNLDDMHDSAFPIAARVFESWLLYFMDLQPLLPQLRQVYSLTFEITSILSSNFSNCFFLLVIQGDISQLEIKMEIGRQEQDQSNWVERRVRNVEPIPILQFAELEMSNNLDPIVSDCNELAPSSKVKIDFDDIQPELDFWNSSLICNGGIC